MDLQEIQCLNSRYLAYHPLMQSDLDMIEKYRKIFEDKHESCRTPQVGDIVEGAYYDGAYPYSNGVVEKVNEDGSLYICYKPYIPFVFIRKDGSVGLSVSGGPFGEHRQDELLLINDEDNNVFCDWGFCGACANGAVNFKVVVRRWRIPYVKRVTTYIESVKKDGIIKISVKKLGEWCNIASFYSWEQLDNWCRNLSVGYELEEDRGDYKSYRLSHDIKETKGFWRLEDLPEGVRPIKLLSNGSIVDGYFRTTFDEVEIYRPNPNSKEVYKPLCLEDHIRFQKENGIF